jgi:uncharacterized protein (TIGR03435 family)
MFSLRVRWMWGTICAVGVVHTLTAQIATTLSFEAASIKPNVSNPIGRRIGVPGDRFVATNESLRRLIAVAYGAPGPLPEPLPDYRMSGGPGWIDSDRFDVEAKALGDVVRGTEGTRRKQLMLQTLLAQRFKLVVHHETRQLPIYTLVLARRDRRLGPKLRRSQIDPAPLPANPNNPPMPRPAFGTPACESAGGRCGTGLGGAGLFKGDGVTMTELIVYFSRWLDRPVSDRTGLTDRFDVELQFAFEGLPGAPSGPPGVERPPTSDNPSIFTAVQEQLGLKLESTKGPVDVLVIDHAEKLMEN